MSLVSCLPPLGTGSNQFVIKFIEEHPASILVCLLGEDSAMLFKYATTTWTSMSLDCFELGFVVGRKVLEMPP